MGTYFDPSVWSRVRAFNNEERSSMRSEPIAAGDTGFVPLAPMENGGWQIGFEWDEPRDIRGVRISFAPGSKAPAATAQYVEFWQRAWPTMNPDYAPGASRGWLPVDSPFNGKWVEGYGESTDQANERTFFFDHVDINEIDNGGPFQGEGILYKSEDYHALFRRTLKLRVVFSCQDAPQIEAIELIGNAVVEQDECTLYFGAAGKLKTGMAGSVSIWNGEITAMYPSGFGDADRLEEGRFALSGVSGQAVAIRYTKTVGSKCDGDRTILQIQTDAGNFSVWAEDITAGVYMEDFDLLIAGSIGTKSPAEFVQTCLAGKKSIFDRVLEEDEQTTERAFREIPEMDVTKQPPYGRYVILGWGGVRQKFCLRYNGDIFANKKFQKVTLRDTAKTHWAGGELHFRIASGDPPNYRERVSVNRQYMPDAAVPVYMTEWIDREVEYSQTSFATLLNGPVNGPYDVAGDEDLVVMNRMNIRNASGDKRTAYLIMDIYPSESLVVKGAELISIGRVVAGNTVQYGWKVQEYGEDLLRARIDTGGKGGMRCISPTEEGIINNAMRPGTYDLYDADDKRRRMPISSVTPSAMLYEIELEGYESHSIDFIIPYPTYVSADDKSRIAQMSFDEEKEKVTAFWRGFYDRAAKVSLPSEDRLNDFIKAVPWHIIMTAMRDPNTGNYIVPAGTYGYGACGNEASMQIRLLDYLGYHEYAEAYLDAYVKSQGRIGLDGNFKSKQGALVAVNYDGRNSLDGMFAYNLDHGYILSCFADHYMLTGDKEWLQRVSRTLVDGCDFVFRERQATKQYTQDGRKVSYYGLLPHGHLEDNPEWRCWFSVNGQTCGGVLRVAKALAEINHPQADRILDEGVRYRDDIREAVMRAMAKAPAAPSGRGGYIPRVPTHAEIRGRDWGWFREVAYGPLHLVYGLVLDPDEQVTTWLLNDLEDNLFISRSYGRIADKEKYWFSRGGITIQSNLLFNDLTYLERGEPERALRALFNNFAQNLYRDMNCFTEHPVPEFGHGIGPFFKTPDESQFLVFLRNHLVMENGKNLSLLPGASREWFGDGKRIVFSHFASAFGPVSVMTESMADSGVIKAQVEADWRSVPEVLSVVFRHPDKKTPVCVTVNDVKLKADDIVGSEIRITNPAERISILAQYAGDATT